MPAGDLLRTAHLFTRSLIADMESQRRIVVVVPDAPCIAEQYEVRDAEDRLIGIGRQYRSLPERPRTLPADIPFFEGVPMSHFVSAVPDSIGVVYEGGPNVAEGDKLLVRLVEALRADGWTVSAQSSPQPGLAVMSCTRGDRQRGLALAPNGDVTFIDMRAQGR